MGGKQSGPVKYVLGLHCLHRHIKLSEYKNMKDMCEITTVVSLVKLVKLAAVQFLAQLDSLFLVVAWRTRLSWQKI